MDISGGHTAGCASLLLHMDHGADEMNTVGRRPQLTLNCEGISGCNLQLFVFRHL